MTTAETTRGKVASAGYYVDYLSTALLVLCTLWHPSESLQAVTDTAVAHVQFGLRNLTIPAVTVTTVRMVTEDYGARPIFFCCTGGCGGRCQRPFCGLSHPTPAERKLAES